MLRSLCSITICMLMVITAAPASGHYEERWHEYTARFPPTLDGACPATPQAGGLTPASAHNSLSSPHEGFIAGPAHDDIYADISVLGCIYLGGTLVGSARGEPPILVTAPAYDHYEIWVLPQHHKEDLGTMYFATQGSIRTEAF